MPGMPSPDPWSAFLDWLTTVIVPDWGELVNLMPFFLVLGVVGPILTLIVLMWLWYLVHRRRGRVRMAEPEAVPSPLDAGGRPVFPPNVAYCREHVLLYPGTRTTCTIDGAPLQVSCPVDGTVRPASIQVCSACGTRYVLGAGQAPLVVRSPHRPPAGGAAAA
jgi:hypothetical protein